MKTLEQVKEELRFKGWTMSKWAREHGVDEELTRRVLRGRLCGNYGESHKIAVLLGIKDGIVEE